MLKINADKCKLIITCKPSLRHLSSNITLKPQHYVIKQTNKVKILGVFILSDLSQAANVNRIKSRVHYRLHTLKDIFTYTAFDTRLMLANSLIVSTIVYALPIMITCTQKQIQTLHTLLMRVAKTVNGKSCFKWPTLKVLDSCNWLSLSQLVMFESVKYIHNIVYENQPPAITSLLRFNMVRCHVSRYNRRPETIYTPTSEKVRNSLLYLSIYLYNHLPDNFRTMNTQDFADAAKIHFRQHFDRSHILKNGGFS